MKEMVYVDEIKTREILASGNIKGHYFAIISYGTHPCAYVSTRLATEQSCGDIDCHGGVTFYGDFTKWIDGKEICDKLGCGYDQTFLGWDYNHCYDYHPIFTLQHTLPTSPFHKWTTTEIFDEVVGVIEQIIKMESD